MRLAERLQSVATDAKRIKEALTFHDPRQDNFDASYAGMSRSDRMVSRSNDPRWLSMVAECAELIRDVQTGRKPDWHLREAMTTSDFPNLFGDLLYRQLLGNYVPYPVSYPKYFRVVDVADFRKLHLYAIDGGQAVMKQSIKERAPYPEIVFKETAYSLQVAKYGRRYGISFEMVINDDLNAFGQRPALMATGARRSEEYLATTMIADVNGPHASFFTAGNKNIVTANPALSIAGLQTAYAVLAAQVDADSEPIVINAVTLVVPPALMISAENILNAMEIWAVEAGGTANQQLHFANWMKSRVTLAINPYIPIVTTAASKGNTSWYLFADPDDATQRPAMAFGFLRGRRQPQLFVKDPNQMQLGGGPSDPLEGDFESDSIDYKLRHIFGATQVDPKMAVASNGSGS